MKNMKFFLIFNLLFISLLIQSKPNISISSEKIDNDDQKITLSFNLNQSESLYSNSINITTDNPNILISDWKSSNDVLNFSKEIDKDFNINLNLKRTGNIGSNANLYVNYMLKNNNELYENKYKLDFNDVKSVQEAEQQPKKLTIDQNQVNNVTKSNATKKSSNNFLYNFSIWTQELIKKSSSIWVQLFLVFILGILMSLTPCIYPVIPITAGILQMQGSKSILYNFFLSLCYAMGIATTFAVFGLTAALGGHFFGQILTQPLFVIFISAFLIYLALAMFGFYEVYIPRFLTPSSNVQRKGSPLSAFIFGAVSGSIASPCLSPGLALLLTIVASLANKFLGFILLFSFGIGLSIPLMIVGTFSSSLNILPKAGMWMEEIKKIFGFLLLGMSFYYLSNILPLNIILWMASVTIFLAGIYYLHSIRSYDSKGLKFFKNCMGILLVSSSIFVSTKAYQKTFNQILENTNLWEKDYNEAIKKAKEQNKNLIIDVGADYCTICKAIDKRVFHNTELEQTFKKFILVKVDATYPKQDPFASLKQKFNKEIIGAPTILIINPNNGDLLKYWRGELYEMPIDEIKSQLEQF